MHTCKTDHVWGCNRKKTKKPTARFKPLRQADLGWAGQGTPGTKPVRSAGQVSGAECRAGVSKLSLAKIRSKNNHTGTSSNGVAAGGVQVVSGPQRPPVSVGCPNERRKPSWEWSPHARWCLESLIARNAMSRRPHSSARLIKGGRHLFVGYRRARHSMTWHRGR